MAEDAKPEEPKLPMSSAAVNGWLDILVRINQLGITGLVIAALFGALYWSDRSQNRIDRLAQQTKYEQAMMLCINVSRSEHAETRREVKDAVVEAAASPNLVAPRVPPPP